MVILQYNDNLPRTITLKQLISLQIITTIHTNQRG